MPSLKRDDNFIPVLGAVVDDGSGAATAVVVDSATGRIKVSATISSDLDDLNDVIITSSGTADVLYYSGTAWVNLAAGASGRVLTSNGTASAPSWNATTGDFSGPASSTDNAVVRFDGTGGKTGQNSGVTISDANVIAGGAVWQGTAVAVAYGGTGTATAAGARTNLGLVIGTDVQAWDTQLDDIAALATTDSNFIVGNGANWVVETGATVRTSLGLAIGTNVQAQDIFLQDIADLTDPNADRIIFWDDSLGAISWLQVGTALSIVGTSLNVTGTATTTAEGISELATAAETTTGTDATRVITPDGLAGSDYGKRTVGIMLDDGLTLETTGSARAFFRTPSVMNGWNLVAVAASNLTAGTANATQIMIRNKTDAADMLSTSLFIDSAETDSSTSATAAVINAATDDVATADIIAIDVNAVHGSAATGLYVELQFQLP